jgi:CRISPR-associated endonuclease/helicase Cas3
MRAWVWDFIDGKWKEAQRADLLPGRTVAVAAAWGGYDEETGFDADSTTAVSIVTDLPFDDAKEELDAADSTHDSETLSHCHWQSIAFHTRQVAYQVAAICEALQLSENLGPPCSVREIIEDH